jgi:hypothetical protein
MLTVHGQDRVSRASIAIIAALIAAATASLAMPIRDYS